MWNLFCRIEISIRQATLKDAAVVTEFNLRLAAETEDLQLDPGTVAAGVKALLQDESKGIYYVAEVGGQVVGQLMITYEWSDWRNGTILWIQSVYVREDHRGKGVFGRLFRHLERLARTHPEVCGIRLYMHSTNERARKCYGGLGMRRTEYEVFELETREGDPTG